MMTRWILAYAFTIFLPSLAHAEAGEKAVIADCKAGGCRCSLSAVTLHEASVIAGVELPAGSKTLVTYGKNKAKWSPLSVEEIDTAFGGDGRCDLELFGPIEPKDGQWAGTVRATKFVGCKKEVAMAVTPMVDAMTFTRHVAWKDGFHPAQLSLKPQENPVDWVRTTPTVYHGTLKPTKNGAAIGVSGRLVASLVTQETAMATFHFTVMGCQVDAVYDFKRTGN